MSTPLFPFKINGRKTNLSNKLNPLKTFSRIDISEKPIEDSIENTCMKVTQIKNPKDLKPKFSLPNKSFKKLKLKTTLDRDDKPKLEHIPNSTKQGKDCKNMKLILHNRELKIEDNLYLNTDTLINSGNFVRKYKLFTDNLLKNAEEKSNRKLKEKEKNSTKSKDFKSQIEELIEKMKKEKINSEKKINPVYKYVPKPVVTPASIKFKEIKSNNNFIKSVNSIFRTVNVKNEKNDDLKTEKIQNLIKKEDALLLLSNTLLRNHYKLPLVSKTEASLTNEPNEEIENVLTSDNILLTETLNSKFLLTDSTKQSNDNLFISRLPINFSIMGRNKNTKESNV